MLVQIFLALAFIPTCLLAPRENSPFTSEEYQKEIKQGFSTNWFKSKKPWLKFNEQNIVDVRNATFRNLRLRCDVQRFGGDYESDAFRKYLNTLVEVVDKCLEHDVVPIISWINREAEAVASDKHRDDYVKWWTIVATALEDRNYLLSFNLFTELHKGRCKGTTVPGCPDGLINQTAKYNNWTSEVVKSIRSLPGNNKYRILILASPKMTVEGLPLIDESIYANDKHMMVEFHSFAAGPKGSKKSPVYWTGNGEGDRQGQDQVHDAFKGIEEFTKKTGLYSYFGAWMPNDNIKGKLIRDEMMEFAKYFVKYIKGLGIPWSLNVLDKYYDTKESKWFTTPQSFRLQKSTESRILDSPALLQAIEENM